MNPQLRPLIELRTIDLRMAEIKDSQRKLPALLETAQAPLNDITKQIADLTAVLDAATKERRSLEKDLEAHESQTEKMRARLSELKTNKEYQAHLFEIEMANKKKGEIEERILGYMERIDQQQKGIAEAQARKAAAAAESPAPAGRSLNALRRELETKKATLAKLEAAAAPGDEEIGKHREANHGVRSCRCAPESTSPSGLRTSGAYEQVSSVARLCERGVPS